MHQTSPSLTKSVTNLRQNADKITIATDSRSKQKVATGRVVERVVSGRERWLLFSERPEPRPESAGVFVCHKSPASI